jgi:DNA-binding CsgD family transcriptional regulator
VSDEGGSSRGQVAGRIAELSEGRTFLDALATGPVALHLLGAAGIGKTAIWQEVRDDAVRRGLRVLSSRPVESETQLGFVGLADLLGDVRDEALLTLPVPQRAALAAALMRGDESGEAHDRLAISLAVLRVLTDLAGDRPVLVAVDDVQWLDAPTRLVIEFAARRVGDARVGFLVAERSDETSQPFPFDRDALDARLHRVVLGPLSAGAIGHVLRGRLGADLSRAVARRTYEASGGNPLFALEIARAIERRNVPLRAADALPVPPSIGAAMRERLTALPARSLAACEVVAALQRPSRALVVQVLGDDGAAGLDDALDAGVLTFDDGQLRFAHPLLRSTLYADLPAHRRHALHAGVAAVAETLEERAWHRALASAEPDAQVAALLDLAALAARDRGAPQAAADLIEQALRLTPRGDPLRDRRVISLAEQRALAGEVARATSLLEELLGGPTTGPLRAEALILLATTLSDTARSIPLLEEALGHVGDDLRLRERALDELAFVTAFLGGDPDAGATLARRALAVAQELDEPYSIAMALTTVCYIDILRGLAEPQLLARAVTLGQELEDRLPLDLSPFTAAAARHIQRGELDEARRIYERQYELSHARGDVLRRQVVLWRLADLEHMAGRLVRAEEVIDESLALAEQCEHEPGRMFLLPLKALVAAERGRESEARERAAEARQLADDHGNGRVRMRAMLSLASLELAVGNPAAAVAASENLPAAELRVPRQPSYALPVRIAALAQSGDLDAAERLVALYEEQVSSSRDALAAHPMLARSRGLILSLRGEHDLAIELLEHAVTGHDRLPLRLELGRSLLALGTAQRRDRRKLNARASLERAVAVFDELGALPWAARAREELGRIGLQRREGLTPTEDRIASLVATGRSNREIAGELHLSAKTIEANLTRIYRKLNVRSRTELAGRLAADRSELLPDNP